MNFRGPPPPPPFGALSLGRLLQTFRASLWSDLAGSTLALLAGCTRRRLASTCFSGRGEFSLPRTTRTSAVRAFGTVDEAIPERCNCFVVTRVYVVSNERDVNGCLRRTATGFDGSAGFDGLDGVEGLDGLLGLDGTLGQYSPYALSLFSLPSADPPPEKPDCANAEVVTARPGELDGNDATRTGSGER
jgi:hypothetical protein